MNIYDILFQSVSSMTGGLIVDVQTAMVGVVTILCVLMGLDFIKDALLTVLEDREKRDSEKVVQTSKLTGRSRDDVAEDVSGKKNIVNR